MNLLLRIAYNGAAYCGFQSQNNGRSVQEVLTAAAGKAFGFPCSVTGCSRTDAGVHARGFCAVVAPVGNGEDHRLTVPPGKVHRALAKYLPDDIAVNGACFVPADFHPRYGVVSKEYVYRMRDARARDPFQAGLVWQLKKPLSPAMIDRMNEGAKYLVGKHDFSAFMAAGSKITDATRTVYELYICRGADGIIELHIAADGFLYNMVRIITGTLTEVAYGDREPADVADILAGRNRAGAGKTAPAEGLFLEKVTYPSEWGIEWQCD
ncbi:MAG: tRNA pseudouridine(38-40) synthase TruA [Clostridia bacterium]|nr:tRNA pseudouridine(38-40) synthase TruA [Clostridia bacterium]